MELESALGKQPSQRAEGLATLKDPLIFRQCIHLRDDAGTSGKQGNSSNNTIFCDSARHADLSCDQCFHRIIDPYLLTPWTWLSHKNAW